MIPIPTEVLHALRDVAREIPLTDDDAEMLLAAISAPWILDAFAA